MTVPDLPSCFSGGDTLDEALTNAQEAIAGHIETLFMVLGNHCRRTRPLQEHHANEDYRDALCWGFVDVDLSTIENKAVRLKHYPPCPRRRARRRGRGEVKRITLGIPGTRGRWSTSPGNEPKNGVGLYETQ